MKRSATDPVDVVGMLAKLVGFPSVSSESNLAIIAFCREWLEAHGVPCTLVPSPDGQKANLFATVGPMREGGVILSGHTDVVPVTGQAWTSDPFVLTEREGRLYGRGTCDMKGFVALALAFVPRMTAAALARPIHIALSYDEEIACRGAPSLVAAMAEAIPRPAAVIVGEPTGMAVVSGHKASSQAIVRVTGHAVHSSRLDLGASAVTAAARMIVWADDETRANAARAAAECPFEPPYTTLHCGMVGGGIAANTVAADAWFSLDVRAVPEEDSGHYVERLRRFAQDEIEPALKRVAAEAGVAIEMIADVPGLRPEPDGAAERLARRLTGDNGRHVVSYGTEAGIFQRAGWSTIVCGPGDIAVAHQPDESIALSELKAGEAFLDRLIAELSA